MIEEARLWHVTVTVAGDAGRAADRARRAAAAQRAAAVPSGLRFDADRAEICYWDEADTLVDAASLALRLWNEHRESASLPPWEVVGLEVVERERRAERTARRPTSSDLELSGPSRSERPRGT